MIVRDPVLILLSLLPIAITVALYSYLISSVQTGAREAITHLLTRWGWSPQGLAAWAILLITQILLLVAGALTFSFAATLVASPFNDLLAERAEKSALPALPAVAPAGLGTKAKRIWIDMLKSLAATGGTVVALLFSWIPVLNVVAFLLAFLLIAFQYVSYPQTRRGIGVRDGLGFLWRHAFASAGFGSIVSILYSIPVLSFLALPVAVVGGTMLVARAPGTPDGALKALK